MALWEQVKYIPVIQGMHIDIFIICHKLCMMLSILSELTVQTKLQKDKNTTTTNNKSKHKSPCQRHNMNSGPLATQSNSVPLDHRDRIDCIQAIYLFQYFFCNIV